MRAQLTVFGGSGATGKVLIEHALREGLRVKVLVRNLDSLKSIQGLQIVKGSLSDSRDVEASLKGSDAVICLFGPRPPYTDIFCSEATKTIVAAMKKEGISRLVCQTGGMIGEYPQNRTLLFKMMIFLFKKRLPLIWQDRLGQEEEVIRSGLVWTLVKPPRLVDQQAKAEVFVGTDVRLGLLSCITREDLCKFLIDVALSGEYAGSAVFLKN